MNTFGLKVIASDKIFFDGRSTAIVVPVSDGEMAVMAHHENMVISIVEGEIRFQKKMDNGNMRLQAEAFCKYLIIVCC